MSEKNNNNDTYPSLGLPEKPLDSGDALVLDTHPGGIKIGEGKVKNSHNDTTYLSCISAFLPRLPEPQLLQVHCCWAQFWVGKEVKEKRTLIITKKITTMLPHTFCHIVAFFPRLLEKPLGFWRCIVGPMKIGKEVEEKRTLVIAKQIQQCCHTIVLKLPHMALVLQCLLPALGGIQCLEKKAGKRTKMTFSQWGTARFISMNPFVDAVSIQQKLV